MILDLSKQS